MRGESLGRLYSLLNDFNTRFSKHTQERQLLIAYELKWLNEKYLYNNKKEYFTNISRKDDKKAEIDSKDKKIIELLEQDARRPAIEIASEVKLTAEATSRRIKNLIKKDIISRFKLRVGHENLNKNYNHIFLSLNDFSKIKDLVTYYENSKNCVFAMKYYGNYDLHLEIVSDSQKEFREIIANLREKFGSIISDYQVISIIKEHKLV